jgi:flagellar hook-associated protein 1 FlgK
MSGLLDAINVQAQSLDAQSTAINTVGKNLANVDNPDYAREVTNLTSTTDGGVIAGSVTDTRNSIIDSQISQSLSDQGSLSVQSDTASTLQSLLGESVNTSADSSTASGDTSASSSESGITTALDNFFNAFSSLSSDPTESSYAQTALSNAQTLASNINALSSNLSSTDAGISSEITSQTSQAQGLLTTIASLNSQIAKTEVGGGTAMDLINERQGDINTLSGLMNITVSSSAAGLGQVDITTIDAGANTVSLVTAGTVNGTLSYNSGTGTFTGGANGATLDVSSGSMAGYQTMRNTISGLSNKVDSLASQLEVQVQTANGGNPFFTLYFTLPTGATLPVTNMGVSNAVTADSLTTTGNNTISSAIAGLQNTTINALGGTFSDYYSNNVVTAIGTQVSNLNTQQETVKLVYNNLLSQQQSAEGVSTDEETANLMVYQRAYQGIANVISVMNTLLSTVVSGMGIG